MVLSAQFDHPILSVLLHLHRTPGCLLQVRALFRMTWWAAPSCKDKSGLQENAWSREGSSSQFDKQVGVSWRKCQGRRMEPGLWRFSFPALSPQSEALVQPQRTLGVCQIQLGLPGTLYLAYYHLWAVEPQQAPAPCPPVRERPLPPRTCLWQPRSDHACSCRLGRSLLGYLPRYSDTHKIVTAI